jgi:hypothetical protein
MSTSVAKRPSLPVGAGRRKLSSDRRAPATGLPFSRICPVTWARFEELGCQLLTTRALCVAIRGLPTAAARTCDADLETLCTTWSVREASSSAAVDFAVVPPSEKTCSSVTVPPFDEVGVPPTVIATYSLPSTE